ncbi:MAG TPA: single-stranded-DNA-specific exonuclease RecJ [Calditrichaeota bacterium]|nr:single-stranded-DNA-specific exonuclease RecJ [Calditrichota bacterium]
MLPRKKWKILNHDLSRSIVDVILENRGLPPDHMDPFRLSDRIHDPSLLPDMDIGVERIIRAIKNNEKIFIYGDYDVDGITSTALMIYFFNKINYPVQYQLPHRERDGYGLRISSVDYLASQGADLIITVDNGITSNDAIDYAISKGIDVVVTDHHLQETELPRATAVINPNRSDSKYPFKTICGAAVAFKLIHALGEKLLPIDDYKQFLLNHLDLVAIGTIADVMPLRDENYALVKFGLKVLANTRKPGLIELKKAAGIREKVLTPISVGFFLAPRLNASGRMEEASIAVELLTTRSTERARELSSYLNKLNRQRQELQAGYVRDALSQIPDETELMHKVIFVYNDTWQAGLIGLVSGNLKERFGRPVFAFTRDEAGNYIGSARSVDAFHVTNALTRFSHYFINYGGHQKAAGLTVPQDKFTEFKEEFLAYAEEAIEENELISELKVDSIVDIDQLNLATARRLQDIGPFGETNPEPLLLLEGARIREIMPLSNGKHLKLYIEKSNQIFECVWWNSGDFKDIVAFGSPIDLVFKLNVHNWQGTERLQLTVEDLNLV